MKRDLRLSVVVPVINEEAFLPLYLDSVTSFADEIFDDCFIKVYCELMSQPDITAYGGIIINADDFGLSKGVNKGIYQLFMQRVVTSTSMLANLPGFHQAAEMAKANPELSVGIHLNLTYGKPLLARQEVKTLVDSAGNFLKR